MRALALVVLLFAPASFAVEFPKTVHAEGQTLTLNGQGGRHRPFKEYEAGLYTPRPTRDAQAVIAGPGVKQLRLRASQDIDLQRIIEWVREGFEKNSKAQMPQLQNRMLRFSYGLPNMKGGDELTFTIVPGKGVVVGGTHAKPMTIPGDDFSQALLKVWLGPEPVDGSLKADLLGH